MMGTTWREFAFAVTIIVLLTAALGACTTVKYVPVVKKGDRAKVPSILINPAKRPSKRTPATTPILEAGRQWVEDRRIAGDEADRSDSLRSFVCAERGGKVIDKVGRNVCKKLR